MPNKLEEIIVKKESFPKFKPPFKVYAYGHDNIEKAFGGYDKSKEIVGLAEPENRSIEYGILSIYNNIQNTAIIPNQHQLSLANFRLSHSSLQSIKNQAYLIGIVWGKEFARGIYTPALDLIGFSDFLKTDGELWQKSNPTITILNKEGDVWMPKPNAELCGNGLIILSEEEKLRRRTESLEEYIKEFPYLSSYFVKEFGRKRLVLV